MTPEDFIKAEARLAAIESIVCQFIAMFFRDRRDAFAVARRQAMESARRLTFPGLGPEYSDAISAEFEAAIERLYSTIQQHLENGRRDRTR